MSSKPTLLIVDDEKTSREGLRAALEDHYDVYVAEDAASATTLLERENFDVLLTDFRLPKEDGMKLIKRAKSLPHPPVCLLMTAYGSEELAVEAMRNGADDYLSKGRMQLVEIEMRLNRALKSRHLETENRALKQQVRERFGLEQLIGDSPGFREVLETVRQIAPSKATVLLLGESGTGKELVAKAIHQLSPRSNQPMVTVNCAAIPATLLEAELFGHEKGAFTGATERRLGRFEQAYGGTLFLDEIGEIDGTTQVKLLRVLGERTFERLGGNKTITADVRLLSATNKDLAELVRQGRFREDLFYRLNVVEITLPPLRTRREDISLLAAHFLKRYASEEGKPLEGFTVEAQDAMDRYPWPGNVRELEKVVHRAVVLARGGVVELRDLPATIRQPAPVVASAAPVIDGHAAPVPAAAGDDSGPVRSAADGAVVPLREAEKRAIVQALRESHGNRSRAALKLGISRRTLHRKLHTYQLDQL